MPLRGFPSRARRRRRLPGGSVATPSHGERRQATVLVADISGYTALCARLDAEQVQALVKRFYDETDRIVVGYGGQVIDHAGDGTLAVFGAPVAHGNDSERAVRAALDMHREVRAIADPSGQPIGLHIGIASGEVVAATLAAGAQAKYVVTGEAVNLAARINAAARDGQTLASEGVWRSVSPARSRRSRWARCRAKGWTGRCLCGRAPGCAMRPGNSPPWSQGSRSCASSSTPSTACAARDAA
jgi:class 3 adenylate cyclase